MEILYQKTALKSRNISKCQWGMKKQKNILKCSQEPNEVFKFSRVNYFKTSGHSLIYIGFACKNALCIWFGEYFCTYRYIYRYACLPVHT